VRLGAWEGCATGGQARRYLRTAALAAARADGASQLSISLLKLLIGPPVANREAERQKIGTLEGIPAMGLDGLASAAYGPEAALTALAVTGAAGLRAIEPITWAILVLLAILCSSYWQTIIAYPNNGGSYVVAKENLGANAGLLAASALMIDYLLNVSVGISAGIGALLSGVR
jgi:amino acid transporter